MEKLLNAVHSPDDIKKLTIKQLSQLAKEIRTFLLSSLSKTGGHLASNLGIVELTIALHYCFCTPKDKIIWDVGHQAYVHKILTGRMERFSTLRKFQGLSGFPKPGESEHDCFAVGHSSTSISAALGFACARDLKGEHNNVIAVIGDGSMTGGLAYEALNNAGQSNRNLIVVLNDNQMSISTNVGAVSRHLNNIRMEPAYLGAKESVHNLLDKIPVIGKPVDRAIERTKNAVKYFFVSGILFEEMGFKYVGPIDGHDTQALIRVFNQIKTKSGPILIHVHTKKGKGYPYAEQLPWDYHGVGTFNIRTGQPISSETKKTYSDIFGETMVELGETEKRLVAISAAMTSGTGLSNFEAKFPDRFFDVAIAEQHAVTFAAGLASDGFLPVFAVYSTFLQRAYDQIVHDVCYQKLHVVFAIDRAGIVGADGETHQGIFDLSFLSHIPHLVIMAPKDGKELKQMLSYAVMQYYGAVAIRYPKGTPPCCFTEYPMQMVELGKSELLEDGEKIALFAVGCMVETAKKIYDKLKEDGFSPMLVNVRFIQPLDRHMLEKAAKKCRFIISLEDNVRDGGFGSKILEYFSDHRLNQPIIINFALPDTYIEQGSREELFRKYGLDEHSLYHSIKEKIVEMEG